MMKVTSEMTSDPRQEINIKLIPMEPSHLNKAAKKRVRISRAANKALNAAIIMEN